MSRVPDVVLELTRDEADALSRRAGNATFRHDWAGDPASPEVKTVFKLVVSAKRKLNLAVRDFDTLPFAEEID